jgi:hypothetical protein
MTSQSKIPSLLAGVAGEYYVAAELSRRGHIASISLRNTRGIDILATNQEGTRSITIQVKTNQIAKPVWILNEKAERFHADNHFYVFVCLSDYEKRPEFHIVPSAVVAEHIRADHSSWLARPGRNGVEHSDSAIRKFEDTEKKYLEQWALLRL